MPKRRFRSGGVVAMTRASKPAPQPIANVGTLSARRSPRRAPSGPRGEPERDLAEVDRPRPRLSQRGDRGRRRAGHPEDAGQQVAGAAGHDPERDAGPRQRGRDLAQGPVAADADDRRDTLRDGGIDGRPRLLLARSSRRSEAGCRRAARARPGPRRRARRAAPLSRSREPNGLTMTRLSRHRPVRAPVPWDGDGISRPIRRWRDPQQVAREDEVDEEAVEGARGERACRESVGSSPASGARSSTTAAAYPSGLGRADGRRDRASRRARRAARRAARPGRSTGPTRAARRRRSAARVAASPRRAYASAMVRTCSVGVAPSMIATASGGRHRRQALELGDDRLDLLAALRRAGPRESGNGHDEAARAATWPG